MQFSCVSVVRLGIQSVWVAITGNGGCMHMELIGKVSHVPSVVTNRASILTQVHASTTSVHGDQIERSSTGAGTLLYMKCTTLQTQVPC